MPSTAFLFPGQGSQAPGMGIEIASRYASARAIFDEADKCLGFALSRLCFEGPADDLRRTEITQPAVLTVSVAHLAALRERGVDPDFVAGHSLGEYSALVAAGSIRFREAVQLVHERGRRMQAAVREGVGAMAALLGIGAEAVGEICQRAAEGQVVSPANINSPQQVVIAGHAAAVARAVELAKQAGARRAVMLDVSAPFHCALMAPASAALEPRLNSTAFADLEVPLVNNWQARVVRAGEEARDGLKRQIANPVLWEQTVRFLAGRNVDRYVEVGPGRVLTGLMRSIDRRLPAYSTHDLASLEGVPA
ncbi:MAG: ACP S-malonyltransferase [Bryobacterales bacterium]|nr:ACP S-malonyltransferase [Bryobacterales bacterium]